MPKVVRVVFPGQLLNFVSYLELHSSRQADSDASLSWLGSGQLGKDFGCQDVSHLNKIHILWLALVAMVFLRLIRLSLLLILQSISDADVNGADVIDPVLPLNLLSNFPLKRQPGVRSWKMDSTEKKQCLLALILNINKLVFHKGTWKPLFKSRS